MTNNFLAIDKNWFKHKLKPLDLLLLAQVAEFERNTGEFFMSNITLAEQFGVSPNTIQNRIDFLTKEQYLIRDTKTTNSGKERYLKVNYNKFANPNFGLASKSDEFAKPKFGVAPTQNLVQRQQKNCAIKDKLKDNSKDNLIAHSTNEEPEEGLGLRHLFGLKDYQIIENINNSYYKCVDNTTGELFIGIK